MFGWLIVGLSLLYNSCEEASKTLIRVQKYDLDLPDHTVAYSSTLGIAIAKSQDTSELTICHLATGVCQQLKCEHIRYDLIRFLGSSGEVACIIPREGKLVVVDTSNARIAYEIHLPKELLSIDEIKTGRALRATIRELSPTGFEVSDSGEIGIISYRSRAIMVNFGTQSANVLPSFNLGGEIADVAFSPMGNLAAIASVGTRGLAIVDLEKLDRLFDVEGFEVEHHVAPQTSNSYLQSTHCQCTDVQFDTSGQQIIGIVNREGQSELSVWQASNGRTVSNWSKPNTRLISAYAVPGTRECLIVTRHTDDSEDVAILINLMTGLELQQLQVPSGMELLPSNSTTCKTGPLMLDKAGNLWSLLRIAD